MKNKKILFGISIAIIILMLYIYFFGTVKPEKVPIHYDLTDNPTSYGNRSSLLLLPTINLILVLLMYLLSKHPEKLNYPVKINNENRMILFKKMTIFLSVNAMMLSFIFLSVFLQSLGLLKAVYSNLIIIISLLLGPFSMIFFCVRTSKNKT